MERDKNSNKKECLFSFAKINKYYLFPFLAPIFCCFSNYFIHYLYNGNKKMELHFFLTIYIDLSYALGGLLYFISRIRIKTEETRNNAKIYKERPSRDIKLIYNDPSKKDTKKIILLLILISMLNTITTITNLYSINRVVFEKRLYFIFYIAIFSKHFLKEQIFKHQIMSMVISIIGLIILFIPVLLMITIDDIFINICNFISAGSYSLFLVMIKYLTHNYYFSPLLCLLFIGLISLILSFLIFTGYSLIKFHNFSFIIDNFDFSKNEIGIIFYIYTCIGIILCSILQVFTIYVVYYFSPILLTVTDSISPTLSWILSMIQDGIGQNSPFDIIIKSVGYFIQLIAGLIYNEIIICNFFGLDEFTKKKLQEREQKELLSIRMSQSGANVDENEEERDNDSSYMSD